jgi:redox-sensitive bicupin YhaK (pirin superfamily)
MVATLNHSSCFPLALAFLIVSARSATSFLSASSITGNCDAYCRSLALFAKKSEIMASTRSISRVVPAKFNGMIYRLIGSSDVDGDGTEHTLTDTETDPFILLDQGYIPINGKPPFGKHPHRGHSVVTLLSQGKVRSWDSFGKTHHTLTGPAAYWVDAGSGVFHEETSVIDDESDPAQHMSLCQLWIGVREADRLKPARVQFQESLPVEEIHDESDTSGNATPVGTITYYIGGDGNSIEPPHPILISMVHQHAGTTYRMPVPASHGGFIVNFSGNDKILAMHQSDEAQPATFSSVMPKNTLDVLVLGPNSNPDDGGGEAHFMTVVTPPGAPADYLVCLGERNGADEPSFKKLVVNGAVIAKSPDEAREIAKQVEKIAAAGKAQEGSFAPFGA